MSVHIQLLKGRRKMRTIEGVVTSPVQGQRPEMLAAQGFQSALIGMMGHDLRQPLHIIKGTYSLLRSSLDAVPQQAWLDRGERAVERLIKQLDCLVDAFYLAERASLPETTTVALAPLFWRLRSENDAAAIQRGHRPSDAQNQSRGIQQSGPAGMHPAKPAGQCHQIYRAWGTYSGGLPAQGSGDQDRRLRHRDRHSGGATARHLRCLQAWLPSTAMAWALDFPSSAARSRYSVTGSRFGRLWDEDRFSRSSCPQLQRRTQAKASR